MTQFRASSTVSAAIMAAGLSIAFAFALGFAPEVRAEGCDEAGATHVEIAKVTDDLDIVLKDERSIRLVGVKALSAGTEHEPDIKLAVSSRMPPRAARRACGS